MFINHLRIDKGLPWIKTEWNERLKYSKQSASYSFQVTGMQGCTIPSVNPLFYVTVCKPCYFIISFYFLGGASTSIWHFFCLSICLPVRLSFCLALWSYNWANVHHMIIVFAALVYPSVPSHNLTTMHYMIINFVLV